MARASGRHRGSASYKSPGLRQREGSYDAPAAATYLGRGMRCPYKQCLWRNSLEFPPWVSPAGPSCIVGSGCDREGLMRSGDEAQGGRQDITNVVDSTSIDSEQPSAIRPIWSESRG